MQAYLTNVWQVVLDLAPWLLLGTLVAGLLHAFLPANFIARHLGKPGLASTFKAALLGVPMPLCSCGVIPAGIGLHKDGASKGASIGFLISTPQTGVDSIAVSASFLGLPFALFKVFSAFVTGLIGGMLTDAVTGIPEVAPNNGGTAPAVKPHGNRLLEALHFGFGDLLYMIWRWVVVGVLVSALITTLIPANALQDTILASGLVAMPLMLLVSLPLYVCATSSVPIAAALVGAGMPTGAALVFLMAGPASNVATIGAVYRAFGGKVLAVYLATIGIGSMVLGWLFEFVLGTTGAEAVHQHQSANSLTVASAVILLGLLLWYAWLDARRLLGGRPAAAPSGATTMTIAVTGMSCQGCVKTLQGKLQAADGISTAEVDLDAAQATVVTSLPVEAVRELIRGAGYEPGEQR